ncbi:MAG: 50S ribosomal protein L10 [Myxococcota bacterium]
MRTRAEKEHEVRELRERLGRATAVILSDYRGLSVAEAGDLRARLRQVGEGAIDYRVTKNTLLRIAVEGTDAAELAPLLEGPNAVALAYDEPTVLAKVLVEYAKDNEKLEIKGGLVEGEVVDLDAIRTLAALPSKDELRAMLMRTLRAPMQNLAGTLHALLGNLRNALEQRQQQLEG